MIEQGLLQYITANAGVQALVAKKVYWVLAPKGSSAAAVLPYIILSRVTTKDFYTTQGATQTREALFQVDCYATDFYGSRAIAHAVRSLLEGFKGTLPDVDSTVVQAIFIDKDWDMPYQEGGPKGFVYRALLQFRIDFVDQ